MKRSGRGDGSGHGGTSGKGHKGQKARSSPHVARGFEGGQMPLHRRSPKWGFTNPTQKKFMAVNLDDLNQKFSSGAEVNPESLKAAGLIKGRGWIKVLGRGKLEKSLKVSAHAVSASAQKAVEAAKGSVIILKRVG